MKKHSIAVPLALGIIVLLRGLASAHTDVPEMDPGMATAGLALLAGSLAMIFGRGKK